MKALISGFSVFLYENIEGQAYSQVPTEMAFTRETGIQPVEEFACSDLVAALGHRIDGSTSQDFGRFRVITTIGD